MYRVNKRIVFTLIGVILVICAAFAYVALSPANEATTDNSTAQTEETPQPVVEQPPQPPGTYSRYSEDAVATTKGTKLLFFHASWCPQCRQIEASIEKEGIPAGVTVFKVDYDSNQKLREKYGVTLQTTFVKIDDAGNKVASYVAYEEPRFSSVERELLR